jgi:hypothetical protein
MEGFWPKTRSTVTTGVLLTPFVFPREFSLLGVA